MKDSKDNLAKFAIMMNTLGTNCSVEITKNQINIYFTALKSFSLSEVEKSFSRVMYSWVYNRFPPVGVFMKAIEESQSLLEDLAEIQASEVLSQVRQYGYYQTPEFNDPVTAHLMSHRFNFQGLCKTLNEGEEKWFVKDFVKAYQGVDRNKENLLIEITPELKQITDNLFEGIE